MLDLMVDSSSYVIWTALTDKFLHLHVYLSNNAKCRKSVGSSIHLETS